MDKPKFNLDINKVIDSDNVADSLDEDQIAYVERIACEGFQIDKTSCQDWHSLIEEIHKLIDISPEEIIRTGIENPSNIKYPLIVQAVAHFVARSAPEIFNNGRPVMLAPVGKKDIENKLVKCGYASSLMNYQLMVDKNSYWERDTEKMLASLGLHGTVFRKTYRDFVRNRQASTTCHPNSVIVHRNTSSLEEARRISHLIDVDSNYIHSNVAIGMFRDLGDIKDLEDLTYDEEMPIFDPVCLEEREDNESKIRIMEQHCSLDLDGDGYSEPYIVTIHCSSRKLLGIYPRYDADCIEYRGDRIVHIEPTHYFTDYHYIPDPTGNFYSWGIGHLLFSTNHTVNSLLNELIDSGKIANQQTAIMTRSSRIDPGDMEITHGKINMVPSNPTGRIQDTITMLPTKEPSQTLFVLTELLIESGKELAATHDVMMGAGQTQNVSPNTLVTMLEQGMKTFSSVQRRIYCSLKREFYKLFVLNNYYLETEEYTRIVDDSTRTVQVDFDLEQLDVMPASDPTMSSQAQKLVMASALMQIPDLDRNEVLKYYLDAMHVPDSLQERMLPDPNQPQQPPAKDIRDMAQAELYKAQTQGEMLGQQLSQAQMEMDKLELQLKVMETQAKMEQMGMGTYKDFTKLELDKQKQDIEAQLKIAQAQFDRVKEQYRLQIDQTHAAADMLQAQNAVKLATARENNNGEKSSKQGQNQSKG